MLCVPYRVNYVVVGKDTWKKEDGRRKMVKDEHPSLCLKFVFIVSGFSMTRQGSRLFVHCRVLPPNNKIFNKRIRSFLTLFRPNTTDGGDVLKCKIWADLRSDLR